MRFGDKAGPSPKPMLDEGAAPADDAGEELPGENQFAAVAGKKAGAALGKAVASGDGAAIYAAFQKLAGICADVAE